MDAALSAGPRVLNVYMCPALTRGPWPTQGTAAFECRLAAPPQLRWAELSELASHARRAVAALVSGWSGEDHSPIADRERRRRALSNKVPLVGLRTAQEKQPFLQERLQAEQVAEGWVLVAGLSGAATVGLPPLAPVTVPLGMISVVFAYVFRKRKAACDAVIDDPPRDDFELATRPQRVWFDPQRLAGQLTPAQVALASHLSDGDALLRAAVRADERAQGAHRRGRTEVVEWQANLSDHFFDEFIRLQTSTADLAAVVADELRQVPALRAVGTDPSHRSWRPLIETLDEGSIQALSRAGIRRSALRAMSPPQIELEGRVRPDVVTEPLSGYAASARERAEVLAERRSARPSGAERIRRSTSKDLED